MRELIASINEPLIDLCGGRQTRPELYDDHDYSSSQEFANNLRWPFDRNHDGLGEGGFRYDSVRRDGGVNVCVFKPGAIDRPITQGGHYQYDWNGAGEVNVVKLNPVKRAEA